ncbi:protein GrpE [Halolactibacillus alkaliphilus]|uniref:Protein GrpE n=1 Tax=Halolactibacillus alkaliphilus TaxID=442899 RepID=A0A511X3A6_9BACI|nr:nucleotide exchange factor GrpE [Halolactibacillus alkaliphilus]GEN57427.1 protein GrpE [Halolactibacillus alkaliphilus]GGN69195.1 protein GrpE [Halolactibacillus alkaliphilus]SFO73949.1 molecular chaperone GrpE [Halolactibacillus alkaliphilus]
MEENKSTHVDEEVVEASEDDIEVIDKEMVSEELDVEPEAVVDQETFDQLEKDLAMAKDKMLRLQAEYDNFRKRTQREKAADLKYKSQDLATELLTVVDNFDRALQTKPDASSIESFFDGMQMVYRQLIHALNQAGVEEIETEGETFDPNVHQAVMQVEDDQYESQAIVDTLQKGYRLKDRVIRPAMVKVNQ